MDINCSPNNNDDEILQPQYSTPQSAITHQIRIPSKRDLTKFQDILGRYVYARKLRDDKDMQITFGKKYIDESHPPTKIFSIKQVDGPWAPGNILSVTNEELLSLIIKKRKRQPTNIFPEFRFSKDDGALTLVKAGFKESLLCPDLSHTKSEAESCIKERFMITYDGMTSLNKRGARVSNWNINLYACIKTGNLYALMHQIDTRIITSNVGDITLLCDFCHNQFKLDRNKTEYIFYKLRCVKCPECGGNVYFVIGNNNDNCEIISDYFSISVHNFVRE